ncbi:hypothetical protein GQ607_011973 [Colletotrichum asianum]|uniref:Uncharacterized protein n=1 Tax=Colletotrichum asianum TaxID=702518 RepID=A0A8H3ZI85_9PEZI|nr:hypothetical protein GQ607_011973 [Colletotrichum asianum]
MLLYPVCFTSPLATVMVPCSRPCSSQACPWMQHSGGSCLVPAYRCSGERSGQHPPTLLLCLANTIQKCTQAMCASRSGTPGQQLTPPTVHHSLVQRPPNIMSTRSERKRERTRRGMAVGGASTVAPDLVNQPTGETDQKTQRRDQGQSPWPRPGSLSEASQVPIYLL